MAQVYNFSSGSAMLPAEVLKLAQQELCDWHGLGTSVMEISHRGKEFIEVAEEAEQDFRALLNIPSNYKVLFCHGGGRGQFAGIPLNILGDKKVADVCGRRLLGGQRGRRGEEILHAERYRRENHRRRQARCEADERVAADPGSGLSAPLPERNH